MRQISLVLMLILTLLACGGGTGTAPVGIAPVNMDDLAKYIVTAESDKAIVVNNASPFGNQALRRTVITSADDFQRVGQISTNTRLAMRFSKSATPAQMQQFARYGKTALRNPRNAAILGALLATGVVVGYELLEEEPGGQAGAGTPQPGPGVAYADIGQLASKDEIIKSLKAYRIPKQTLDAVSEELSLPGQSWQNATSPSGNSTSRTIKASPGLSIKPFLPALSSAEARIAGVNFLHTFRNGKLQLDVSVMGKITNQTRTLVKARFFDPEGKPLKGSDPDLTDDSGQIEASRELIGVISATKFHTFSAQTPLKLSLPAAALTVISDKGSPKCRVEVRQKSTGKLLAASAVLPIQ